MLGLVLGALAFGAGWIVAGIPVGLVVGISVILVCIWAATVGSLMPLMARALSIDPAVISAPLVTTLVDATGLVIYFLVAGVILGIERGITFLSPVAFAPQLSDADCGSHDSPNSR